MLPQEIFDKNGAIWCNLGVPKYAITKVKINHFKVNKSTTTMRERSGSVVECLTRDRRVAGSSLTGVTALWSLSKTHLS